MMKKLRENTKTVLWGVIIAFVVTIFVAWGMKGEFSQGNANVLAKVNGEEVTYEEIYPIWTKQIDQYREAYKDGFTDEMSEELKNRIVQQVAVQKLMLQTAKKMDINVTTAEVINRIKSYPGFQTNGIFDSQKYKQAISNPNIPWADVEDSEKKSAMLQKLERLIKDGAKISESELKQEYINKNEQAKIRYVFIDPLSFEKDVLVTPSEIQSYYEQHKMEYNLPLETVADKVKSALVRDKARPITAAKSDELVKQIKAGANFANVSGQFGKLKTTEIFTRGKGLLKDIPDAVNIINTAFSLNVGQVSDAISTSNGYYVIQLIEKKPADESKYIAGKEDLRTTLLREKENYVFQDWFENIRDKSKIKFFLDKDQEKK
ncbi:MAG: SurA N-terminal domain-containing protein [Candidatus Firestonebacteria bacterium]